MSIKQFPLFSTLDKVHTGEPVSVDWFWQGPKPTYLKLRTLLGQGKVDAYDALKATLPATTPTGFFNHIKKGYTPAEQGFIPSGYGMLDVDGKHHPDRDQTRDADGVTAWAHSVKARLTEQGFACALSPSGDGVKAFYRLRWDDCPDGTPEDQWYRASYYAALHSLPEDIDADRACSNLTRIQYQTWDPKAGNPEEAIVVEPSEEDLLCAVRVRALVPDETWIQPLTTHDQFALDRALEGLHRKPSLRKAYHDGDCSDFDGDRSRAIWHIILFLQERKEALEPHVITHALLQAACSEGRDPAYFHRSIQKAMDARITEKVRREMAMRGTPFEGYDYTDASLADAIIRIGQAHLRFIPELDHWTIWREEDGRWLQPTPPNAGIVLGWVSDTLRTAAWQSQGEDPHELRRHVGNVRNLRSAMHLASKEKSLRRSMYDMDCQYSRIHIRGVGVLDLDTWQVSVGSPEDFISMTTRVTWRRGARNTPRFRQIIDTIFTDPERWAFMRRYLGSALYAGNPTETLLFAHGEGGRNGKSTVCFAAMRALGDYAQPSPSKLLVASNRSGADHRGDIVSIPQGCRLLFADEEGDKKVSWDLGLIKHLVTEEAIHVRAPYAPAGIEKAITFTILAASNHFPTMDTPDAATMHRLKILTFENQFPKDPEIRRYSRSTEFQECMLDEILHGLRDYQQQGLNPPACCDHDLEILAEELDVVAEFIEEECFYDSEDLLARASKGALLEHFNSWLWRRHRKNVPTREFNAGLRALRIESKVAKVDGKSTRCLEGPHGIVCLKCASIDS
ncbi:MAG: BT4734/BF3469 family protein [Ilumatobacteraceae bacterium]